MAYHGFHYIEHSIEHTYLLKLISNIYNIEIQYIYI